ncbi:MAG: hypothetical protein R3D34_06930 [Nitratireductor sp.]
MRKSSIVAVMVSAGMVASCAKSVDKIAAAYVSPLQYEAYDCDQLAAEGARVSRRASEVMGVQQKAAQGDAVAMGVGLVLFWPALFFIKGNGATEAEVARLKGEMETIEQVSIQKQCGIQFQRPEPPKQDTRQAPTSATPT